MGRHIRNLLLVVVVIFVFRRVPILGLSPSGLQEALLAEMSPGHSPDFSVFHYNLSYDISRSGQGVIGCGHFFFRVYVESRDLPDIPVHVLALQHKHGERLQSLLTGFRSPGLPFGPVREVEVFHFLQRRCAKDGIPELVCKLTLFLNGSYHYILTLFEIAEVRQTLFN